MISWITKTVTDESRQEALAVPVLEWSSTVPYSSNVRRRLLLMFQLKRLGPVSDIRNAAKPDTYLLVDSYAELFEAPLRLIQI